MEEHWARGKGEAVARTKFPNTNGMREANALSRSGLYMIYQMYTAAHGSWPQAIAPKTNGGSHKLTSPRISLYRLARGHVASWNVEGGRDSIMTPTAVKGVIRWVTGAREVEPSSCMETVHLKGRRNVTEASGILPECQSGPNFSR